MVRFSHHPCSLDGLYIRLIEDTYRNKGYNTTFLPSCIWGDLRSLSLHRSQPGQSSMSESQVWATDCPFFCPLLSCSAVHREGDRHVRWQDRFFNMPTQSSPDESSGRFCLYGTQKDFDIKYGSCEMSHLSNYEGTSGTRNIQNTSL